MTNRKTKLIEHQQIIELSSIITKTESQFNKLKVISEPVSTV